MRRALALAAVLLAGLAKAEETRVPTGWTRAEFVVSPDYFVRHTPDRQFIGPGMFRVGKNEIIMAAPWGRPPVNFEELAKQFPVPPLFRSTDGGRTWREEGALKLPWALTGMISDGGI